MSIATKNGDLHLRFIHYIITCSRTPLTAPIRNISTRIDRFCFILWFLLIADAAKSINAPSSPFAPESIERSRYRSQLLSKSMSFVWVDFMTYLIFVSMPMPFFVHVSMTENTTASAPKKFLNISSGASKKFSASSAGCPTIQ
mgnify:CR=1 FL=1